MGHLEVIHVPAYSHLKASDIFVGNAGIVGVNSKTFGVYVAPDFVVEEQRGL